MKTALVYATVLAMGFLSGQANAEGPAINPQDYPKLTDKQLGQIRHMVKLSRNLSGDWSGFESQLLPTERSMQFQVSFAGFALALAQHGYTPAYRELYQPAIENLIAKLQHPDIWERWMFSSRGGALNGVTKTMQEGWIDPLAKDNIMLKGYLFQLAALHEMLYGGHKYDQPGAFTFEFRTNGFGNGHITYRYTLSDLAKIIHQEYVDSGYVGSACEPGFIFYVCNSVSNAGFMVYDAAHGTHYADILPKVKATWIEKGFLDPKSYQAAQGVFTAWDDRSADQRAKFIIPLNVAIGPWGGPFNYAWDREFIKAAYYGTGRFDRDSVLREWINGDYAKRPEALDEAGKALHSEQWALFIAFASEVGDNDAVDKMLDYAERNYHPIWQNGEYYYPRNDDYSVDAQGNSPGVDNWTDKSILIARLNRTQGGDGFYKLYNEPWGEARYKQPYVSDVDALTTGVTQAFYDADKQALIVTLVPGPVAAKQVSFKIRQLDSKKSYEVTADGRKLGRLDRSGAQKIPSMTWQQDGSVLVDTGIESAHTFIFAAR